jgi:hypothetical protein
VLGVGKIKKKNIKQAQSSQQQVRTTLINKRQTIQAHNFAWLKYLCSFINVYTIGSNVFVIKYTDSRFPHLKLFI